jgi:hypothetical protein
LRVDKAPGLFTENFLESRKKVYRRILRQSLEDGPAGKRLPGEGGEDSGDTSTVGIFSATARRTDRNRSPGLILRGFRTTNLIWVARVSRNLDNGALVSASKAIVSGRESRVRQPSIRQTKSDLIYRKLLNINNLQDSALHSCPDTWTFGPTTNTSWIS